MEIVVAIILSIIIDLILAGFVISVHELGHALVAWFLGGVVYEIKFGIWEIVSFKLGKTKIGFGAFPIGGLNDIDFAGFTNKEQVLVLLGGPALNILMFFILASFLPGGWNSISFYTVNLLNGSNSVYTEFVTIAALFHFCAAALNVIPFPLSDGFHVISTLTGHREF